MTHPAPCLRCHLTLHCVCDLIPQIKSPIHIALLMHENELRRETNTGQWLLAALDQCSSHVWQRKSPTASLIELIKQPNVVPMLLFPSEQSISAEEAIANIQQKKAGLDKSSETIPVFIILDGTWQEAKKMANKIPWLDGCQHIHLSPDSRSHYQLRRNQADGHLCTLEVGAELLKKVGKEKEAAQLNEFLNHYMNVFHADKCGHQYRASK
ncbi:DTW domain-containing protein [Vibrio sp. ZSDE26]|uniref:tRNA-uridine aminocarboxypropyltransferase n=1 Tax=Vibrio amylolyticus TaxID=2847292 RepID=A0A9X2BNA5_9VIBR|nr:DTW domain-containing protein [Vibrio amylolyticus]MCK6265733.1 DTW domain-containing protein [Vibrio amylolyticus]